MDKIEHLAMLKLNPEEKEQIKGDLEKIVAMFDKLQEVDTEGVEPLIHMNPHAQKLAADVPEQHIDKEKALANAKHTKDGFFTVPKIVK